MVRFRTHPIQMTNQARVLRSLRLKRGLSMRQAGELCGKSGSYVSQIENGRMKPPVGRDLERLLEVYGESSVESFYEKAQRHREQVSDKDEIKELIERTNQTEDSIILKVVRAMIA